MSLKCYQFVCIQKIQELPSLKKNYCVKNQEYQISKRLETKISIYKIRGLVKPGKVNPYNGIGSQNKQANKNEVIIFR